MKSQTLIRVSIMFLLATVVSVVALLLVYTMQNPQVVVNLASIGWNGYIIP